VKALALGAALAVLALAGGAPAYGSIAVLQSAESCPELEHERAFIQFLDPLLYALLPGGAFETGGAGWTTDGTAIVAENEPFHVHAPGDSHSLSLPRGSSARSPAFCGRADTPTLRFFARSDGSPSALLTSKLRVSAIARTAGGREIAVPLGSVGAAPAWRPTRPFTVLVNTLSIGKATPIAFRFRPAGRATWLIDDVYVDPFRRS
jgi:hypothetical protein